MPAELTIRLKRLARGLRFGNTNPGPTAPPQKFQEFSIGIYVGNSPFRFEQPANVVNPVLTRADVSDVKASLVADPFMLKSGEIWHMFFEVMNLDSGRGEIALALSKDGWNWAYQRVVLAEPFHLSYPYVFEWMDEYWMIPESHQAGSIRLYRAEKFPFTWRFVTTLLRGRRFVDSSLVRFAGRWFLFTETDPAMQFDTARLYCAEDLMGPWSEHPRSPIVERDPSLARPGGRVLVVADRVVRYVQDCYPDYGMRVRATEVAELTTTTFSESVVAAGPVIQGSGSGWNRDGMHHVDAHPLEDGRWIACVDGWGWVPPGDGVR